MIRPIVKDVLFLSQKSLPAVKEDLTVGIDLMDTLQANRDRCVGMAANMIGVKKRIIIAGFCGKQNRMKRKRAVFLWKVYGRRHDTAGSRWNIPISDGRNRPAPLPDLMHRSSSMRWIIWKEF